MMIDFDGDLDFKKILTNPILDIAARFWEKERYEAFRICYRSMRRIDDLVDDAKTASSDIPREEAVRLRGMIFNWLESVNLRLGNDSFQKEFISVRDRFKIPFWPWQRLYRSMVYDLEHDGFRNFRAFVRYAEGAAVAPASVFMHLCGVTLADGRYSAPFYDIRKAARALALFSYLVHIMRDFQKDQLANLSYFADDLLAEQSLTVSDLRAVAEGASVELPFRNLMKRYVCFAGYYRKQARRMIERISPLLTPRYRLSLEIIYGLYLQIFERIDPAGGQFTADELNPSPVQIQSRIGQIVNNFSLP